MPSKSNPSICLRDLVQENTEMINCVVTQASRMSDFLFGDYANTSERTGDNPAGCTMTEILNQQALLKQALDVLSNIMTKLGG